VTTMPIQDVSLNVDVRGLGGPVGAHARRYRSVHDGAKRPLTCCGYHPSLTCGYSSNRPGFCVVSGFGEHPTNHRSTDRGMFAVHPQRVTDEAHPASPRFERRGLRSTAAMVARLPSSDRLDATVSRPAVSKRRLRGGELELLWLLRALG
jgi:hypothetical protein